MGDEPTPIGGPASGSRFVTRRSLLALLLTLPPGPVAAASRFSWPWHACGQMVARAVLTLLRLDGLIVHMHVVLDGRHVLMSQQFLQTEGIVAQYQVADRKGMTEDVRADALVSDPCTLADAFEEQGHPVPGQRQACFGEDEVVLASAAPFGQLFPIRPVLIQVVKQIAQTIIAQGDAPFFGAFPCDREDAMLAVEIREA
jgi:hypothetical protein